MQTMSVSVIIPVYNRPHFIRRAVESVLRQTVMPDEVLVIDDGSTDATPSVLRDYTSRIRVIRTGHRGVSHARNVGLRAARSQWIAFLDSDDMWLSDKLQRQWEWLKAHPDYRVVQTEEIWIRGGRRVNPRKIHRKPEGWIFRPSLVRCLISPSSVLIHRSVFEQVGFFDETLPAVEDFDLWLRVTLHYPVGLVRAPLVIKYGGHPDQLSKAIWGLDQFRIYAIEKVLFLEDLDRRDRQAAIEELIRKIRIFAEGSRKRGYTHTWALYMRRLAYWQRELAAMGHE